MKKRIISLLCVLSGLVLTMGGGVSAYGAQQPDTVLKFNSDGKFKILILSDVQDTDTPQKESMDMVNAALDKTNPDLVIFLGDNIAGWWKGVNKEKTVKAIRNIAEPVDSRNIPFALVFGNHDHEGLCDENNKMTEEEAKEFMMSVYQEYPTCLAVEGEEMTGCGNYNLLIKNSAETKDVFNLWLMDSNPYAQEGGYGYVQQDQTDYYIKKSNELKEQNGGKPLPSLLFQHIIVPEAYELFDKSDKKTENSVKGHSTYGDSYYTAGSRVTQGELLEGPCPADVKHNQFESWKQQGDIIGAFFGHDHNNTFSGNLDGIELTAVPAAGYYSYGFNHGVRTITLDENNLTDYESEIILSDELLDYQVKPDYKAKHGAHEYSQVKKYTTIGLSAVGALLIASGFAAAAVIKKKKKEIKALSKSKAKKD